MFYHWKDPEKPTGLFLGTTWISAVNIGRTTIHSGFWIKPGIKLLCLNDKYKADLRLSDVNFLLDDLPLVWSDF